MAENYSERSKEELLELARERDVKGRSSMDKDELVQALEEYDQLESADSSGDEEYGQSAEDLEGKVEAPEEEAQALHHSEASDPANPEVKEGLSEEGKESLEKVGEDSEYAQESDLALDASGPLIFEDPTRRPITGAVNEEHAKEQEEQLKKLPEGFVGDAPEVVTDEFAEQARQALEGGEPVQQEDVIDFPPPLAEREEAARQKVEDQRERHNESRRGEGDEFEAEDPKAQNVVETQGEEGELVGADRTFDQRAQLYTDGLGGTGDHNLERSYRVQTLRAGIANDVRNSEFGPNAEALAAEKERQERSPDYS